MLRRALKPLWVLLALIFLLEAWLWDQLEPIMARVVAALPLARWKAWFGRRVEALSPAMTLLVFLIPAVLLFPLKVVAVWMLAHHHWLGACAVLGFGKLVGVGAAAFIFDVTRPKLMQMNWFAACYALVLRLRVWAEGVVAPVREWLRAFRRTMTSGSPRWMRRIRRTRRRLLAAR